MVPCGRITDCRAPTEELRVRLGHGVAGDVRVTGEGVDRTPQSITVGPVQGLDVGPGVDHGDSALHHLHRARMSPKGDMPTVSEVKPGSADRADHAALFDPAGVGGERAAAQDVRRDDRLHGVWELGDR